MASYPGNPVAEQGKAVGVGYYWDRCITGTGVFFVYSLYLGILLPIIVSHFLYNHLSPSEW